MKIIRDKEKGSLALEQVLFIGAVVTIGTAVFAFYGNVSSFIGGIDANTLGAGGSNASSAAAGG